MYKDKDKEKETKRLASARFRANHREELKTKAHEYYAKNREKISEQHIPKSPVERVKKREWDSIRYQKQKLDRETEQKNPILLLSETDIAYIAGLIDGEGCLSLPRFAAGRLYPTIQVIMTHHGVVKWLAESLGTKVNVLNRHLKNPKHKPSFEVRIMGKRADLLCHRMLPYLHVKKQQAEILIECYKTYLPGGFAPDTGIRYTLPPEVQSQREAMKERITILNRRGPPPSNVA